MPVPDYPAVYAVGRCRNPFISWCCCSWWGSTKGPQQTGLGYNGFVAACSLKLTWVAPGCYAEELEGKIWHRGGSLPGRDSILERALVLSEDSLDIGCNRANSICNHLLLPVREWHPLRVEWSCSPPALLAQHCLFSLAKCILCHCSNVFSEARGRTHEKRGILMGRLHSWGIRGYVPSLLPHSFCFFSLSCNQAVNKLQGSFQTGISLLFQECQGIFKALRQACPAHGLHVDSTAQTTAISWAAQPGAQPHLTTKHGCAANPVWAESGARDAAQGWLKGWQICAFWCIGYIQACEQWKIGSCAFCCDQGIWEQVSGLQKSVDFLGVFFLYIYDYFQST